MMGRIIGFPFISIFGGTSMMYVVAHSEHIQYNGVLFVIVYIIANLFRIICNEKVTTRFIVDYILRQSVVVVFVKMAHMYFNEYGLIGWFLIAYIAGALFVIVDRSICRKYNKRMIMRGERL